jgi:hypothetical protein
MSPDTEQTILEALKAGQTYRQIVEDGLASSTSRVAAVAKKHGFKAPPHPRKPRTPKPPRPRTERGTEQNRPAEQNTERAPTEKRARARSRQVDPDLVDEHFQQDEILADTLERIENHAKSADYIARLTIKLVDAVRAKVLDDDGQVKKDLSLKDATEAIRACQGAGDSLWKGNAILRKNRGLYDRQLVDHSGRIDGDRGGDTIAKYLGFPLQGTVQRSASVPAEIPGGPKPPEDLVRSPSRHSSTRRTTPRRTASWSRTTRTRRTT